MNLRGYKVTNAEVSGHVTVVGEGVEGNYVTAALARVRVSDRLVQSLFLPEPTDNSPLGDVGSNAYDVNLTQTSVGGVVVPSTGLDSYYLPARWYPAATPSGIAYQILPLLPVYEDGDAFRATLFRPKDGGGYQAIDLNTQIPTKPTWYLKNAFGINDQGWIVA